MRYFQKLGDSDTFGYDDTRPDQIAAMDARFFIGGSLVSGATEVTGSWPPVPTAAQIAANQWAAYQSSARAALMATDSTVARISEAISLGATTATTTDVVAFMQYRKTLRVILSQVQPTTIPTALPTKPPYPANT